MTSVEVCDDVVGCLEAVYAEACQLDVDWVHYDNDHERKRTTRELGPTLEHVRHVLESPLLAATLSERLGLPDLELSPDDWGAGLHVVDPGGYLRGHLDYARHPHQDAERRMNVIAFLNPVWKPHWGGTLRIWGNGTERRIDPVPGRVVAWACSDESFHEVETVTGPCPRVTLATYFLSRPCRPGVTRTKAMFLPVR